MITRTIKDITSVLFTWLLYLIGMLPIINCGVVVYWLFNPDKKEISFDNHHGLTYVICVTAFFTFGGILWIGAQPFLFFIPGWWGRYDDDFEWITTRSSIASILAFLGSIAIVQIFEECRELRNKIKWLEEEKYRKEDEYKELKETLDALLEEEDDDGDDSSLGSSFY